MLRRELLASMERMHLLNSFRRVFQSKRTPCNTSNVILWIKGVNIMLLSPNQIFSLLNMLNDDEKKLIRAIESIGTLQMGVSMFSCFQVFKMLTTSPEKTYSRANIKMRIG